MDPIWIAIIVFVVVAVVLGVLWRGNTLDKLEALAGEELRFEERGLRVKQVGGRTPTLHLSCTVRVTNKRLIIGSKMLFSQRHALIHVHELDGVEKGLDLGSTLKTGYQRGAIARSAVSLGDEDGKAYVELPMHWLNQRLRLYCKETERCCAAIEDKS